MERDTSNDSELQKIEAALCDNLVRGLAGYDEAVEYEFESLFYKLLTLERDYQPSRYIHPSSIGGCKRKMYYVCMGEKPKRTRNSDLSMITRMGISSHLHDWVQELVAKLPGDKLHIANEVHIPEDSAAHIRYNMKGRCDTLISMKFDDGGEVSPLLLIDYKFISALQYSKTSSPKSNDVMQLTAYLFAFGCPKGALMYFNKDTSEHKTFFVDFNKDIWEEIVQDIITVQEAVKAEEPPNREINFFFCKNLCKYGWLCKPPLRSRLT